MKSSYIKPGFTQINLNSSPSGHEACALQAEYAIGVCEMEIAGLGKVFIAGHCAIEMDSSNLCYTNFLLNGSVFGS